MEEAREHKIRSQMLEASLAASSEVERGLLDSLAEYEDANRNLLQCEAELACLTDQIEQSKERLSEIKIIEHKRTAAILRREELLTDASALGRRHEETLVRLGTLRDTIAEEVSIRAESDEFQQIKVQVEELDNIAMSYHDLNTRRLELRSKIATTRGRLEVEVEHVEAGLKDLHAKKSKLEKALKQKDAAEQAYQVYKKLLAEEQDMARRREAFASLSMRVDELHTMVIEARLRLEAEIQQRSEMLEDLEQLIKSREMVAFEQEELKSKVDELDRLENEFELVEERGLKLKAEYDGLVQQVEQHERHIRENEEKERELRETPDLSTCPLCRSAIVDRMAVMQRYYDDTLAINRDIANLKDRMHKTEDDRAVLRKQYVDIRKRLEERSRLDTRIGQFNEKQSALDRAEANRNEILKGLTLAKRKLEEQAYAQIERESLVRIKGELAKLEFDPIIFSNLQSQIRAQRHTEFRWQQMQSDSRELSEVEKELPAREERVAQLKKALKDDDFEEEARGELTDLEGEMKAKLYDKDSHLRLKQRMVALLPTAERLNDLNRALVDLPLLDVAAREMSETLTSKRAEAAKIGEDLELWSVLIEQQLVFEAELQQVEQAKQDKHAEHEELARKVNVLSGKLGQLKAGKEDLDSKRQELLRVLDEMNQLLRLADAFGKKGIQAVLIDNAIPELETEANRILARLSDNQMHVGLVTQHRTAKGSAIETLDILIADELGTRSYELYSGGETFKVNFALRVALSRLLARRAGAKLETLIIDEGFGSQDELSRERLIRAINSIKGDFGRILVVTHIAEVKDMFPVQILVNKEEGLSSVSISNL
jgi:DNA repair protein SbcC/Rad50